MPKTKIKKNKKVTNVEVKSMSQLQKKKEIDDKDSSSSTPNNAEESEC